jgi:hypothetical protein
MLLSPRITVKESAAVARSFYKVRKHSSQTFTNKQLQTAMPYETEIIALTDTQTIN